MVCVCSHQLDGAVQAVASLPLEDVAGAVPSTLDASAVQQSSLGLMAATGLSTSAGASGGAGGSASAATSAQVQSLFGAYAALGIDPLSPAGPASMSAAVASMNQNLPPALAVLAGLFGPIAGPLGTLAACLSASSLVQSLFGFPLTAPDAGAQLASALSGSSSASSTASASTSAGLGGVAQGLGYDLSTPAGQQGFAAVVGHAASFDGSLGLPLASLGLATGSLGALGALASLGLDLGQPNAAQLAGALLPALFAGVGALQQALSASASSSASAGAAGSASASACAGASTSAGGSVPGAGLALPALPDIGQLALGATLVGQLGGSSSVVASSACGACPLQAASVA